MKTIQKSISLIFLFLLGLSFNSCDKIDDPYDGILVSACDRVPGAINIWGDTANVTVKKMLIEEITGHTCGNCPAKTKLIIDWVDNEFKQEVFSVAYHATSFANPVNGYPADFRTAKGTEFNQILGNSGAPVAMFNRTVLDGAGLLVGGSKFDPEFRKIVDNGGLENPKIQLKVHNQYDEVNKTSQIGVTGKALADLDGDYTVIIFVLEDKVISDQKDYDLPSPSHITEYEHRHMFRDAIGPLDGNAFISGGLKTGESIEKCFPYKLNENWDSHKCVYLVAVKNLVTGEIIQADEVHALNN